MELAGGGGGEVLKESLISLAFLLVLKDSLDSSDLGTGMESSALSSLWFVVSCGTVCTGSKREK